MLRDKRLFLFDIDGTIAVGDTLYPGSAALLSYIEKIGGKACFITNNSTKSNADYVKKFAECFHLSVEENQFVTAGYLTLLFLKRHFPNGKVYVLGTKSFIAELKNAGLNITEECEDDIACILCAYDSELTYEKLSVACKVLLTKNVPYYATNPDLCCPAPFGFIPDCGSICQMLQAATKRTPVYIGKPAKKVVDLCRKNFPFSPEETLVVGDRLYTDIACGINAGVDTCVLYTGEATPEEVKGSPYKPTYEFANVQKLLEAVIA